MSTPQHEQKPPQPSVGHHTQPGVYHSTMPQTKGVVTRSGAANQPPRHDNGQFKKMGGK